MTKQTPQEQQRPRDSMHGAPLPGSVVEHWGARFHPLGPEGQSLYRIFFALWLIVFGTPTFAWIAGFPASFYNPPPLSLAALLSDFPPGWFFQVLDVVCASLVVLLLVGCKTRAVSLSLFLVWLVGNHFKYTFGKVDHDILRLMVPFCMAFSGWGRRFSLDALWDKTQGKPGSTAADHQTSRRWPVPALAALLAFGFFTAGFPKLLNWIDFDLTTSGARGWAVRGLFLNGRDELLVPYMAALDAPVVWELLDYVAVTFELAFIVLLRFPTPFRALLAIACAFHASNIFMYNISFISLVSVYALFFDWDAVASRLQRSAVARKALGFLGSWTGLVVAGTLYLPAYFALRGAEAEVLVSLLQAGDFRTGLRGLLVDAAVLVLAATLFAFQVVHRSPSDKRNPVREI